MSLSWNASLKAARKMCWPLDGEIRPTMTTELTRPAGGGPVALPLAAGSEGGRSSSTGFLPVLIVDRVEWLLTT